jgi:epoxyqueuosine reductase QueG
MLRALERTLAGHGLNLIGAASPRSYDALVPPEYALARLLPGARSAIVIGNGGPAFWGAFRAFCRAHPEVERQSDPLDAFTATVIEEAVWPVVGALPSRIVYPFRFPADPVSFVHLAECAGLGRRSLLGLLVHPTFGPWIALRAAVLLPVVLATARPADGFDPCPTCIERACVSACPAGAIGDGGWDIPRCAAHRLRDDDECAARCHARFDCVIGREYRQSPEELAYHQSRARGALAGFVRVS